MNAPENRNQIHPQGKGKLGMAYQELKNVKEEIEMQLSNVMTRMSTGLAKGTPVKILGGLIVGALLITTAVVLPLNSTDANTPASLNSVSSAPSSSAVYVDEFEEWGMVLDGNTRATSAEYVDEFEEWGMVRRQDLANS